jgi:hypothetical protein
VRIVVWEKNPQNKVSSATFGGILPFIFPPYHISINTDNLHKEEIACEELGWFEIRLLQVFLHELAHFITQDENKANKIAWDILKKILKEKTNNSITQMLAINESFAEKLKNC